MGPQVVDPQIVSVLNAVTPCGIEWVAPPTNASRDSENAPLWYQMLSNIYDSTYQMMYGYNTRFYNLCLLVVEEPTRIYQAMKEVYWKQAMDNEM